MNTPACRSLFLALLCSLAGPPARAAAEPPRVHVVSTPGDGLQPDALVDAQGTIHLVYLKGDPKACDVFYVHRAAGEPVFSAPQRVNSQPGSAVAIGTIRGAQLALGRNGSVHVLWNGSGQAMPQMPESAPLLYSRRQDAGGAFAPQRSLSEGTVHLDGGGAIAADERGRVFVVWQAGAADGPRGERHRAVFVGVSADDGRTFAAKRAVSPATAGVCACCALETALDQEGRLSILYRSVTAEGSRDLTWLRSDGVGRVFLPALLQEWRVAACPMSSMALVRQDGGSMWAAWETRGQVHRSLLQPGTGSAGPRLGPAGGAGNRRHPVLATRGSPGDPILMAWAIGTGWQKGGAVGWELTESTGRTTSGRAEGLPVWSRPAAVAGADGSFTVFR
jgi:hypothetical protein